MYTIKQYLLDKKHRSISGLLLNTTDQCNCRCKYCDFVQYKNSFMTMKIAEQSLKFLDNLCPNQEEPFDIGFFGGEPLLNFELIKKLVLKYKDKYYWSITTNGTLFNDEILHFFIDNQIGILLSIDGNKLTQDFNRPLKNGKSSFDKLEPYLKIISNNFPNTVFRSTLYPPTVKYLTENYFYAISQGFRQYYIIPDEYSTWTEDNVLELEEGLTSIIANYIMCLEQGIEFTHFSDIDKYLIEYLLNKNNNEFKFETGVFRCGLGFTSLGVGTTGKIFACQEHASIENNEDIFYIGDIYNGINNYKQYILINTYYKEHLSEKQILDKCKSCEAKYVCHKQRCPSRNYLISNHFNTCTWIRCQWVQLLHNAVKQLNQYFELNYCKNYENFVQNLLDYYAPNSKLEKDMVIKT